MKTNEERFSGLMDYIDSLSRIHPSDIPDIDLYMDQVTTFMDAHLASSRRLGEDRVLTKTMINNYAKNNLLPPPEKKKYSKNHILLLTFIYYFKNVLSFKDIEQILSPIAAGHFESGSSPELAGIYEEVFSLEAEQRARLTEDVRAKFESAMKTFSCEPSPDRSGQTAGHGQPGTGSRESGRPEDKTGRQTGTDSRQTDGQTDRDSRQTDGQTAGQADRDSGQSNGKTCKEQPGSENGRPLESQTAGQQQDGRDDRQTDGKPAFADREYLRLFSFICELAFDVYLKKQMLELIAEQLRQEAPAEGKKKKERK